MPTLIEIRPGEGGDDAHRFAAELAQAYAKMAQSCG